MKVLATTPSERRLLSAPHLDSSADRNLFREALDQIHPESRLLEFSFVTVPGGKIRAVGTENSVSSAGNSADRTPWLWIHKPRLWSTASAHIVPEAIWVMNWDSANLYHWFSEGLPRVFWAKNQGIDAPVLVPPWLRRSSFIYESLRLLSLESVTMPASTPTSVRTLFFPEVLGSPGNPRSADALEIRRRLRDGLRRTSDVDSVLQGGKFWITRQASRRRREVPWTEVRRLLHNYGYEVLSPERLSMQTLLSLLMNASVVGGVHGAGLTNSWVLNPGSTLIEVRKRNDSNSNCYFSLSNMLGFKYNYAFASSDSWRWRDWRVQLGSLEATLSAS